MESFFVGPGPRPSLRFRLEEHQKKKNMTTELAPSRKRPPVTIPFDVMLWKTQDVAAYLGVSDRQVTGRYAVLPGFPKPFRLPSEKGEGFPRWKATEVVAWAEEHR